MENRDGKSFFSKKTAFLEKTRLFSKKNIKKLDICASGGYISMLFVFQENCTTCRNMKYWTGSILRRI